MYRDRADNDLPYGEPWILWAARWCVRGTIGVFWPAVVIGALGGCFYSCLTALLFMPTPLGECKESVSTINISETCGANQKLRLEIDPTDHNRTLALCECIKQASTAPSASQGAKW